jgi:cell division septation protein DedD
VQLGAYASESAARVAWATLVAQSADLLSGQTPVYSPNGRLVRLQLGPFGERSQASALCARLSAAGRPCFVTAS